MEIRILEFLDGAKDATGLAVVIDVFRAFSVGCYVMSNGAKEIIAVSEVDAAFRLKKRNPGYILMGERNERKVEGFDYGNSPTHVEHVDFSGKTVVQTTSAGTRGLILATAAEEVITGSLVNADAVAGYIQKKKPSMVSLVAMGYAGKTPAEEDRFCAEYIKAKIFDQEIDFLNVIKKLKAGSGKRFFDPKNSNFSPPNDFYLCTQMGIFDFILRAEEISRNSVILKKHTP